MTINKIYLSRDNISENLKELETYLKSADKILDMSDINKNEAIKELQRLCLECCVVIHRYREVVSLIENNFLNGLKLIKGEESWQDEKLHPKNY